MKYYEAMSFIVPIHRQVNLDPRTASRISLLLLATIILPSLAGIMVALASPAPAQATSPEIREERQLEPATEDQSTPRPQEKRGSKAASFALVLDDTTTSASNTIADGTAAEVSPIPHSTAIPNPSPELSTPPPTPVPTSRPTARLAPATAGNYEETYNQAEAKYGIPWQIVYGLHLTETGLLGSGTIMNRTGSGARGPMQFMPGTWRAYGVDGNGDGEADIDNVYDAIHSAAHYLSKYGSIQDGLRHYGGNSSGTIAAARAKGWDGPLD